MSGNYPLLLEKAARLYERHEAGRQDTFNVFSVLRSESDEVNLHSRFLAALLDYRKSPGEPRRNLEAFLDPDLWRSFADDDKRSGIGDDIPNFEPNRMIVERESDNIDILIHDPFSKQVVVIENKIHAGDQPRQLIRYTEQLERRGYLRPHVLYLTIDGHEASEDSAGGVGYTPVSYKKLIPWLKRCQERACDIPALRESVAQYLHLVQKLTGTDFTEAYMNELKELCLKDNNLVLVHDLSEAMTEAKISLLVKLWKEIECALREKIQNLPDLGEKSEITEERVRKFVTWKRNYNRHGLFYKIRGSACFGVEVEDRIYIGVWCPDESEYKNIGEKLEGGKSDSRWPWYERAPGGVDLKNLTRENLELLANDCERKKYAAHIATRASEVWEMIEKAGLAQPRASDS